MPAPTITEINEAKEDIDTLESFVNDAVPADITSRLGTTYPNIAKISQSAVAGDATGVSFDNSVCILDSLNVQAALEELADETPLVRASYAQLRALDSSDLADGQVIKLTDNGIAGSFIVKSGYSGSHTGASNASVLTDSGQSWSINELTGLTVTNTTDGSSGLITSNTATTITATLSGGTDNDWDSSDAYTVTAVDDAAIRLVFTDDSSRYAMRIFDGTLSVSWFGTVADGVTDDSTAIQAAMDYIRANYTAVSGVTAAKLVFPPGEYSVQNVILLPFGFDATYVPDALSKVLVSGYGATLIGSGSDDTDNDIFESAFFNNGSNLTSIGTGGESHLAYGVVVEGFHIRDARRAFYLQNWNQGCAVRDIFCYRVQQSVYAKRCFYTNFENIKNRESPTTDSKPDFQFTQFSNIIPIRGLHSSGHAIGYQVGGADGLTFFECSLENSTDGMVFSSENSLVSLISCYLEACTNSALRIDDIVRTLNVQNCFINNDAGNRVVDASALPSSQFALINFIGNHIESGNMDMESNIYGTFQGNTAGDAPFEGGGVFGSTYAANPKIVNWGPEMIVDTSGLGYDGPVRLINLPNQHIVNPGHYTGGYGDRVGSDTTPFHDLTVTGTSPTITYTFVFDIPYDDNLMGCWHLSYVSGGTTVNKSYLLMSEPGSGTTAVKLYARDTGSDQLTEVSTLDPGRFTITSSSGNLSIAINNISDTHSLNRSILRLF